jgi:uncharacterized cupin superfamily protein
VGSYWSARSASTRSGSTSLSSSATPGSPARRRSGSGSATNPLRSSAISEPFNVFGGDWEIEYTQGGRRFKDTPIGPKVGGELLGASLYELEPNDRFWPYHFHHANEELLVVLRGTPTLRGPAGERALEPGDCVHFPRGPEGGHTLSNTGEEPARFLIFSTLLSPEIVSYPDSGKIGARSQWTRINVREESGVDYWEGEE